eukprot:2671361-Pleurochrysis_carterae.AAC.1
MLSVAGQGSTRRHVFADAPLHAGFGGCGAAWFREKGSIPNNAAYTRSWKLSSASRAMMQAWPISRTNARIERVVIARNGHSSVSCGRICGECRARV